MVLAPGFSTWIAPRRILVDTWLLPGQYLNDTWNCVTDISMSFDQFLLSSTLFWLLLCSSLASSLPFLLEDLRPETDQQNLAPIKKAATRITHIPEDEPTVYNVVVTSKEEKNATKGVSRKGMGDQICPGDLEQCLEACLPVLAILELAHTFCVEECKQRCAP